MAADLENVDVSAASNYTPTTALSFKEWYSDYSKNRGYGRPADTNYGFFGDLANFFTGGRDDAEKGYDAYLQNLNAENAAKATNYANDLAYARELKATQDARNWDKFMSDTQYQRAVADLKAAGLNPWLALQNGVSGSSVPNSGKANASASVSKGSQFERKTNEKGSTSLRDISLLLFAIARLAAV